MKKGTNVGKIDANLEAIKVGDRLRRVGTEEIWRVNEYGSLQCGLETVAGKEWNGGDYEIVENWDFIAEAPKMTSGQLEEAVENGAEFSVSTGDGPNDGPSVRLDGEPVELIEDEPGATVHPLAGASDQELADELRSRGYEVKATRTVTIEI